mmetsp:Transcript_4077/g.9444  ORF Transcript_4077/g.9444 Transcript_4077/m.9444 type:complete len:216 (-) Transcript_4077:897-1544(-)
MLPCKIHHENEPFPETRLVGDNFQLRLRNLPIPFHLSSKWVKEATDAKSKDLQARDKTSTKNMVCHRNNNTLGMAICNNSIKWILSIMPALIPTTTVSFLITLDPSLPFRVELAVVCCLNLTVTFPTVNSIAMRKKIMEDLELLQLLLRQQPPSKTCLPLMRLWVETAAALLLCLPTQDPSWKTDLILIKMWPFHVLMDKTWLFLALLRLVVYRF